MQRKKKQQKKLEFPKKRRIYSEKTISSNLAKTNPQYAKEAFFTQTIQSTPFREKVETILEHTDRLKKAKDLLKEEILSIKIPFDTIMRIAAKYKQDSSIKALETMFTKKAVDDVAKEYWIKYFGEYGELLTREYQDILKSKVATVKDVLWLSHYFERNYGKTCLASAVLNDVISETFSD